MKMQSAHTAEHVSEGHPDKFVSFRQLSIDATEFAHFGFNCLSSCSPCFGNRV